MQRPNFTDANKEVLSVIDELQIGLYQFDYKGRSTCSNIIFQNRLGYTEEEINAKTVFELFTKKDSQDLIDQVNENHPFSHKRLTAMTKDGTSHSL